jgi:hypothetical protein
MLGSTGVLPFAQLNGETYFLLGRERPGWKSGNLWTTFGGRPHKHETDIDGAAREGEEESMGLIGTQRDITLKISNKECVRTVWDGNECSNVEKVVYFLPVPLDLSVPYVFSTLRRALMGMHKQKVKMGQLKPVSPPYVYEGMTTDGGETIAEVVDVRRHVMTLHISFLTVGGDIYITKTPFDGEYLNHFKQRKILVKRYLQLAHWIQSHPAFMVSRSSPECGNRVYDIKVDERFLELEEVKWLSVGKLQDTLTTARDSIKSSLHPVFASII